MGGNADFVLILLFLPETAILVSLKLFRFKLQNIISIWPYTEYRYVVGKDITAKCVMWAKCIIGSKLGYRGAFQTNNALTSIYVLSFQR